MAVALPHIHSHQKESLAKALLIFLEEMSYCDGAELPEAVNALRLPTIRTGSTEEF